MPPLEPAVKAAFAILSGSYADKHIEEVLLPGTSKASGQEIEGLQDLYQVFCDPTLCLRVFFGHYAFSRRGKDKQVLLEHSLEALTNSIELSGGIEGLLALDDGEIIWTEFVKLRERDRRKIGEQQNRGILQGFVELAQEIYREDGKGAIGEWAAEALDATGGVEDQFQRVVDIRGVGPKNSSALMRDVVLASGLERRVTPIDRIHIQPIDRWVRSASRLLVPEEGLEKAADWILAGKICKYTRAAGVSGLRFNIGTTYFGRHVALDVENMPAAIGEAVKNAGF